MNTAETAVLWAFGDGRALAQSLGMTTSRHERPSNRYEVFIGRAAAMCVHPHAAWRTRTRVDRMVILASYFTAAYATVLAALVLLA